MVRFKTKFGAVPVMVAVASVPGAPVVTVPIVKVGVSPSVPAGPVHTITSERIIYFYTIILNILV